jgi:hypothetical protein
MLMQNVEVQRLGPPIHDRFSGRGLAAVNHRAFANVVSVHVALLGLIGAARATRESGGGLPEWNRSNTGFRLV